jgi:hypothetical protein
MTNDNGMSRRDLLGKAGGAGLAALGLALLPGETQAGLRDYPSMARGHDLLVDAKAALEKGEQKFGGHRANAIKLIDDALEEIRLGVRFQDGK